MVKDDGYDTTRALNNSVELIADPDMFALFNCLRTPMDALIASDNTVSLHLLRRAGFKAAGWSSPAVLLRGQIDGLQLNRTLRCVVGSGLARADMHLPT